MPTLVMSQSKTANINVRVDPAVKEESEKVLDAMGFSMSGAINSFLRQIVIEQRLPYQPSARKGLVFEDNLTKSELDTLLADAAEKITPNSGTPMEDFFSDLSKEYSVEL